MTRFLWKRRRNVQQGGLTENKYELVSGDAAFCNVDEARTRLELIRGMAACLSGKKIFGLFEGYQFHFGWCFLFFY